MIPLGYQFKRVYLATARLGPPHLRDVYAVSDCLSGAFDRSLEVRSFNEHGFYDSPAEMRALAAQHGLPLDGFKLFYYEAHELVYVHDEQGARWRPFDPDTPSAMTVEPPSGHTLEGFDVAALMGCAVPCCSPLSCNGLADELPTNEHCLLPSFEAALRALESGSFAHSEPGPYQIIAVYSVAD